MGGILKGVLGTTSGPSSQLLAQEAEEKERARLEKEKLNKKFVEQLRARFSGFGGGGTTNQDTLG